MISFTKVLKAGKEAGIRINSRALKLYMNSIHERVRAFSIWITKSEQTKQADQKKKKSPNKKNKPPYTSYNKMLNSFMCKVHSHH